MNEPLERLLIDPIKTDEQVMSRSYGVTVLEYETRCQQNLCVELILEWYSYAIEKEKHLWKRSIFEYLFKHRIHLPKKKIINFIQIFKLLFNS